MISSVMNTSLIWHKYRYKRMKSATVVNRYRNYKFKRIAATAARRPRIRANHNQNALNRIFLKRTKKNNKSKRLCIFFCRFGRCNKGKSCPFQHDKEKISVCTRYYQVLIFSLISSLITTFLLDSCVVLVVQMIAHFLTKWIPQRCPFAHFSFKGDVIVKLSAHTCMLMLIPMPRFARILSAVTALKRKRYCPC